MLDVISLKYRTSPYFFLICLCFRQRYLPFAYVLGHFLVNLPFYYVGVIDNVIRAL